MNGIVVVLGQLGGEFQQGLFVLDLVSLEKGRGIYRLVLQWSHYLDQNIVQ